MKASLLALCLFAVAHLTASPPAGQAELRPDSGDLSSDSSFTVSFADAMVSADRIDDGDAEWPIAVEPKLEARFRWQSTTEGELSVRGQIAPGTHYVISTAPGLKDTRGRVLPKQSWEFDSAPFDIKTSDEAGEREQLSPSPRFELQANFPVSMFDAAEHIFFQDRASHERRPVEIILHDDQGGERDSNLTVAPREPLPMGHRYDLVIDGLCDAFAHRPLPFLHVFPAGTTEPLKILWLGAYNQPMKSALLRAKFNETLDPGSVKAEAVTVVPSIPDLKVHAEGDELVAEGKFDLKQHYVVQVKTTLRGLRGYGLAAEERWGATFHPKISTIVFPGAEIFQRSARGLKFAFLQVNTGPAIWKLSPVAPERLPEVLERLKEYHEGETPLDLPVAAQGKFEANGAEEEVLRQIDDQPAKPLSGPYVLEVTAPGASGSTVGNRLLVSFSEYVLTQKKGSRDYEVRVAGMSDGKPVAGLTARALTRDGVERARASTDAAGIAHFSTSALYPAKTPGTALFLVETPLGLALQYADAPAIGETDSDQPQPAVALRGLVVTDRNLYRPGQTIKMHGTMRWSEQGELRLPQERQATWEIKPTDGGQAVASGKVPLNEHGSWEAEWNVPAGFATGMYEIRAGLGEQKPSASLATVQVEEYRVPLFSVEVTPVESVGNTGQLNVASTYFHGAPNAGARVHWTALWTVAGNAGEDDQFIRSDAYSEHHLEQQDEVETQGDAVLDAQGQVALRSESPFKDRQSWGRCRVAWHVDVTSPEAQTFSNGVSGEVQSTPGWVGVRAETHPGAKPAIGIEVSAIDLKNEEVKRTVVQVELFHVRARTVKERVANYLTRYRNTSEFEKVGAREVTTPGEMELPANDTGTYVAVVTGPGGVRSSTSLVVAGDEEAELPVESETQFPVKLPEPDRAYRPGEVAPLSVNAPFPGVAWVSVETDRFLDTMVVPLAGNAGRIDLPIKKEYAPNATVSVYLLQPGGGSKLPRERLGQVQLKVDRPDRLLQVEPKVAAASVKPGQAVRGEVKVTSGGKPVAGAELVVFAVDEAVLRLGEWSLPDSQAAFYPERPHTISTCSALSQFIEQVQPKSLLQKGYVVGDGGEEFQNSPLRKEFKALAFWQAGLHTDGAGKVQVEFPAPDNLTEFRLVAIGSTDANQFGGGSVTFKVSKPLLCEPALPRFARFGDDLTLRAVVRQTGAAKSKITVRCTAEGIEMEDQPPQTENVDSGVPAIFNFKARAGESSTAAKVRFEATSDFGEKDVVEVSLPLEPPTVLRHETFATAVTGSTFRPAAEAPASWKKGIGSYEVMLSTSPDLPELNGLPAILQYPHGCFEQISTRVLAYALMTDLLGTLPDAAARDQEYRAMLQTSLKRYEEAMLPSGMLPYWPGEQVPNSFVTVLAAWAAREAEQLGIDPSPHLRGVLDGALDKVVKGESSAGAEITFEGDHQSEEARLCTRCLALMVAGRDNAPKSYGQVAEDLYLKRSHLADDARALLAIALQEMKIMPKEQAQLVKEISAKLPVERAFNPRDFSSTVRVQAITTLALARLAPGSPAIKERRELLDKTMADSSSLSTQENLWLLLAFKALHDARPPLPLETTALAPVAKLTSRNHASAAWPSQDMARLGAFQIDGLPRQTPLTALVAGEYRSTEPEIDRTDRGLRVERVSRNLSDAKRLGTAAAPFKLGDQILITYRLLSRKWQYYVALEDLLPAGLETVNPDLPAVAKTYRLPPVAEGQKTLVLSHSELRDHSTNLYFDEVEPGVGVYSVLVRATAAGRFHWPATQAYPMYDARVTGLSAAETCVVQE